MRVSLTAVFAYCFMSSNNVIVIFSMLCYPSFLDKEIELTVYFVILHVW